MRFIHAADLHIDSPLRGLGRYPGAPVERLRGATRLALERLVDLAIDERVDFVLIAGDLYDRDWQDFHTGLFVRGQMVRLERQGIRVFIIQGNHDAQGVISRQVPWPVNVTVFPSLAATTVLLENLGVAVHGQSFADRDMPNDLVPGYPEPRAGWFNIGLLHTSLTGAEGHDPYAPTTLATLRAKGYDYWALGHVHAREVLSEQPRIVFPGNLQGRHARETGAKGCELVTVEGSAVTAVPVAFDVVRWHQLTVDLGPVPTLNALPEVLTAALSKAAAAAPGALHAVRVILAGETVLHGEEARRPGTLAAAVQAAAQDLGAGEVWVEKVLLDLRSPLDRDRLAAGTDALAELVRWVDALAADPEALRALCQRTLDNVTSSQPLEVRMALEHDRDKADLPDLEDIDGLRQLLHDAEATLLARIQAGDPLA